MCALRAGDCSRPWRGEGGGSLGSEGSCCLPQKRGPTLWEEGTRYFPLGAPSPLRVALAPAPEYQSLELSRFSLSSDWS